MCPEDQHTIGLAHTQHFTDTGAPMVIQSPTFNTQKIKYDAHNATIAVA